MPSWKLLRPAGLILWTFLAASPAAADDGTPAGQPPLWPMDLPERHLTSNFMEYRGGRYHAGLDLKTRSREGYPVYAVEAGWVERVRAAPSAYGRAVYVRGRSGRIYVYAHLARFNDDLRARLAAARGDTVYAARLSFAPGELPVVRGQVLGLSGQSGTGGPHLHFEVRDAANRPLDPQAWGFAVPDTTAPRIEAVRVLPAAPGSRIAGGEMSRVLRAGRGGSLAGRLPALPVTGPVALSAVLVEVSDVMGHRLEPWLIEVELDGQTVYRCRNEAFAFADNAQQLLEWLDLPGLRERWLHRRPGVDLEGREGELWFRGPDGRGLAPGRHELRITAADRAGNRRSVLLPLEVGLAAGQDGAPAASAWTEEPVQAVAQDATHREVVRLTPFFDVLPEDLPAEVAVRRLAPPADPVLAPLTLAQAPFAPTGAQLEQARRQGLRPAGGAALFVAADWPVASSPAVEIPAAGGADSPADGDAPLPGLYRWERDRWRHGGEILGAPDGEGSWRAALDEPGPVGVFRDVAGPVLTGPTAPLALARGMPSDVPGVTAPAWEVFAVGLRDDGTGVDHASVRVWLDGAPLVVEPDGPRDRLLVELPSGTAPGRHTLRVFARDKAGHPAELSLDITCTP